MKKYFLSVIVIINTILAHSILAQDKLIKLSPEIKDTIDLSERDYYNLYPNIEDFYYAMIYLKSDSTIVTKIICRNDEGLVRDTLINNSPDYVGNLKASIRQMNSDRLENYESDDIITVTKLDGNQLMGKLLSVQDSSIILCPDGISAVGTLTFIQTFTKLDAKEVQSVFIDFDVQPSVNKAALFGALLGCISGAIIGINNQVAISYEETGWIYSKEDAKIINGFAGAAIGGLSGAIIGAGIGYLLSPADETIEINSASDIEQLKGYLVE